MKLFATALLLFSFASLEVYVVARREIPGSDAVLDPTVDVPCYSCKLVVNELAGLSGKIDVAKINATVYFDCMLLTGNNVTVCKDVVYFVDKALAYAKSIHFDPNIMCKQFCQKDSAIGRPMLALAPDSSASCDLVVKETSLFLEKVKCPFNVTLVRGLCFTSQQYAESLVAKSMGLSRSGRGYGGIFCSYCEEVVGGLNSVVDMLSSCVEGIANQICHEMPSPTDDKCLQALDEAIVDITVEIEKKYVTNDFICNKTLGLC